LFSVSAGKVESKTNLHGMKKKDELDKKRLKTEDNKSLIEEYSEISKLIFETLKMRQEMKVKTNMSEDEIAAPNK
jgi:hypothetical protein